MREESVNFDHHRESDHRRDNLEVLKLRRRRSREVKMIYITRRTTRERLHLPGQLHRVLQTYLEYTGPVDAQGKKSAPEHRGTAVPLEWLTMITRGCIWHGIYCGTTRGSFISIDDNELVNLRKLCTRFLERKTSIVVRVNASPVRFDYGHMQGCTITPSSTRDPSTPL